MPERAVALRIAVRDAEQARQRLLSLGEEGEAALKKIESSSGRLGKTAKTTTGETQGFVNSLRDIASEVAVIDGPLGGIASRFNALATSVGRVSPVALGSAAAVTALTFGFIESAKAAAEEERSLFKIEAVIKATGQSAGRTTQQIQALADDLGESTLASADSVEAAAAQLLTFRSIAGETFDRTLRLSQDLAEVGFGSIESAAVSLAKALEDPEGGLNRLRRVGVSFTESQKDLIKELVETGRVAEAQTAILDVLEQQVGGAGVAAAGGLAGAVDTLSERWERLLETVGNTGPIISATRALSDLLGGIERKLSPTVESIEEEIRELQETLDKLREQGRGLDSGQVESISREIEARKELLGQLAAERRAREVQEQFAAESAARSQAEAAADQKLSKEKEKQAEIDKELAKEAENLTKKRAEALEELEIEVRQNLALAAANEASADSYEVVSREIAVENELRKVGLQLGSPEAAEQERLIRLKLEYAAAAERSTEARKKEADAAKKAADDLKREQEREKDKKERELEREADRQADLLQEPLRNFLQSVQSQTADVFENILSGGVTTFEDLFDQALILARRFAAEMAALLVFQPQLIGSLFGGVGAAAAGTTPSLAQSVSGGAGFGLNALGARLGFAPGAGAARGPVSLSQPITGVAAGQTITSGFPLTLSQTLGFGAAGALGGGLLGGFFGGQGQIGGALGGGLGAIGGGALGAAGALGGSIGGPGGALIGGAAGSLLGAVIGSFFGGSNRGSSSGISGGERLGRISGTGLPAQFVREFDRQLIDLLDRRQRQIANQMLASAAGVQVKFQETLSAGDVERLAAGRIAPIARGLGFRASAIAGHGRTPEEQLARLAEALDVQQSIRDLTSGFGDFEKQAQDLNDQFKELKESAHEFEISTEGLGRATREARLDLIRDQIRQVSGTAPTFRDRLRELNSQFRDLRASARELGVGIEEVTTAQIRAQQELRNLRIAERGQFRDQLTSLSGRGLTPDQQLAALNRQIRNFRTEAERLGIPLKEVNEAAHIAREELARQQDAQRRQLQALGTSRFAVELLELNARFGESIRLARQLGIDEQGLIDARLEARQALHRAHRAEIDQMVLSVLAPFDALADPLKAFKQQIEFNILNPVDQFSAAQADFRRIANEAAAGSTIAIEQLAGAGQLFIEQAGRFGASPGQVSAVREVSDTINTVLRQIEQAQREALSGDEELVDAVADAKRRIVDTLGELRRDVQLVSEEVKRLRRT